MAACRVCNEQTESRYEERTMAKFRTRLKKVMEEAVPEDSVICYLCQFDLEQIEMYYCLLNALKKRYWDAAEVRSKFPEGYVAPTNRNILVETFKSSAFDSQDISEGRKPETVISMGVHSKIGEASTSTNSIVESLDQVENGLELGRWSKGSSGCQEGPEEHQESESLTVISALNLYSVKNAKDKNKISTICSKDKRGYFFYEGSNITDQVLKGPERKTWLHVPLKRKVGRPRKNPVGNWIASATPRKNEDLDWHPMSNGITSPRKRGRPRKNLAEDAISGSRKPVTSQKANREKVICKICGKALVTKFYLKDHMALHTRNLQKGEYAHPMKPGRPRKTPAIAVPRKPGRPTKYPVEDLIAGASNPGRPTMNHVGDLIHPSIAGPRKPGRLKKYPVGDLIAGTRNARRPTMNHVRDIIHPSIAGPRKPGRPRKCPVGNLTGARNAGRPTMNPVRDIIHPAIAGPRKPGRPRKNASLGPFSVPDSFVGVGNCAVVEVDEGLRVVPLQQGRTQGNNEQSTKAQVNKSVPMPKKRGRPTKYPRTEEPCKCQHCGIKLPNNADFISHNLTHNDTKPFKCASCGKGFGTRVTQMRHEQTHMGKREKFICSICGKALLTKYYLKHHMARHTGKGQYHCSICGQACVSKSAITVHMLVHTDKKPYKF